MLDRDGPALAGAQLSLTFEPLDDLRFTADAETRDERFDLSAPVTSVFAAEHGSLSATYSGFSAITLGLSGGFGHLSADDQLRGFAGPEIGLPRLFGDTGDLSIGYQEALGFVPGRTVWAQAILHPIADLEVFARLSYLEDRVEGRSLEELGAFVHADFSAWTHFRVRATILGTVPVWDIGELGSPIGFFGQLSLVGEL